MTIRAPDDGLGDFRLEPLETDVAVNENRNSIAAVRFPGDVVELEDANIGHTAVDAGMLLKERNDVLAIPVTIALGPG